MANKTNIEWTEVTWNPVTGCSKVSSGCKNCYAERMAIRLKAMGVKQYEEGFNVKIAPKQLLLPYSWKKRKIVFVNSMSDLFHEEVPFEYIKKVFDVMNNTQHIFQVLTKRSDRLLELSPYLNWSSNIWMGVSVENQKNTYRISHLRSTLAYIKFLSIEPLIGHISNINIDGIDWVIVGGESGPNARPIRKSWVELVRNKCLENGTPFFFKQWGKREFNENQKDPTINADHYNHAKGGCQFEGRIYKEMPV